MRFEASDYDDETAMSIVFEPEEVSTLLDITEQYTNSEYEHDHVAFWVSSIILNAMKVYAENRLALKIGLDSEECPIFIDKINESTAKYLEGQMQFWQVVTPEYPHWLLTKMTSLEEEIVVSDLDKSNDPFNGVHLYMLENKLARDVIFTKKFQKMARTINQES